MPIASQTSVTIGAGAGQSVSPPSVAVLADGRIAYTWMEYDALGPTYEIFVRTCFPDGSVATSAVEAASAPDDNNEAPAILALADGGYMIAWTGNETTKDELNVRFFDADGTARTLTLTPDPLTTLSYDPVAIQLTNGNIVLSWTTSLPRAAQVMAPDGTLVGSTLAVAGEDMVALANSRYAAVWSDGTTLRGAIANSLGDAQATFEIATGYTTVGRESVDVLSNGNIVFAWTRVSTTEAFFRIYSASGASIVGPVELPENATNSSSKPDVTALADGRFVVVFFDGTLGSLVARIYAEDGTSAGDSIIIASPSSQVTHSTVATPDGRFAVTWNDGDVVSQIFDPTIFNGTSGEDTYSGGSFADHILGAGDDDTLNGMAGGDIINGDGGADTLDGGEGDDTVYGGTGDDLITGGAGVDRLYGQAGGEAIIIRAVGDDTAGEVYDGGADNDSLWVGEGATSGYILDLRDDTVTGLESLDFRGSIGTDTGMVRITAAQAVGIQTFSGSNIASDRDVVDITMGASTSLDLSLKTYNFFISTGAPLRDYFVINGDGDVETIIGSTRTDIFNPGGGADSLTGGDGDDIYNLGTFSPTVIETFTGGIDLITSEITRTLPGNVEWLALLGANPINGTGNTQVNIITGNNNNNILDGGSDASTDSLIGLLGNDTYVLRDTVDTVTDSGGVDLITSTIDRTLASYATIDNLTLLGTAINGAGNALANILIGNAQNNFLTSAGTTVDTLQGLDGNDTYDLNSNVHIVIEAATAGAGTSDRVRWTGTAGQTYILPTNVENLVLSGTAATNGTGNTLANIIAGNSAANQINAGQGGPADTLLGGDGDDVYLIDGTDAITEAATAGSGNDLVRWTGANGATYIMAANVERLILSGFGDSNGTGNAVANTINGNGSSNVLTAAGASGDTLVGGAGGDTYNIAGLIHTVTEGGGADVDRVNWTATANQTYTLAANVEILVFVGGAVANATGNAVANTITGNNAANILTASGTAADTLIGLGGNDTYNLASDIHVVTEAAGGGTADKVNFSGTNGQTYVLDDQVEQLALVAFTTTNGTGNALANTLTGNTAINTLRGGGADDILIGAGGCDTLFGDANNDTFRYLATGDSGTTAASRDTISDFDDNGNDVVDLTQMAGVTAFIGAAAFTAAGQVRATQVGVNVLVEINTAGANGAESTILIANATLGAGIGQVDAGDFLL